MKRHEALRGDPAKTRAWVQRSRKRLQPKSAKRLRVERDEHRPEVRAAVFARDGYRCRLLDLLPEHRCYGPLTPHHLRKAGAQGAYTLDNLVTLCAYANDTWVEDHPLQAEALGLVIR